LLQRLVGVLNWERLEMGLKGLRDSNDGRGKH
jgi:hypothetical protein